MKLTNCVRILSGVMKNHKTIHLLKWDKFCKPKIDGGLGLRSTRAANTIF